MAGDRLPYALLPAPRFAAEFAALRATNRTPFDSFALDGVEVFEIPLQAQPGQTSESRLIRIEPGTDFLEIELRSDEPTSGVLERVTLLDRRGHVLAVSPVGEAAPSLSIRWGPPFRRGGAHPRMSVVVKVGFFPVSKTSEPNYAGGSAFPIEDPGVGRYTLVIRRYTSRSLSAPAGSTTDAFGQSQAPIPVVTPPEPRPSPTTDRGPGPIAVPDRAPTPRPATVVVSGAVAAVATGPLPSRAAAAIGGVFASGGAAPVRDPSDPSVVDLSLLELAAPPGPPRQAVEPEPLPLAGADLDREPATADGRAVVALRGPGGFPLFGSTLRTEVPTRRSGPLPELPRPLDGPTPIEVGLTANEPSRGAEEPRRRAGLATRVGSIGRTSALAAASIGLALTFGPSFPDLESWFRGGRPRRSQDGLGSGGRSRAGAA